MIRRLCQLVAMLTVGALSAGWAGGEYAVTDLVASAKTGDGHAVHRLIADGADLDARGPMDFTALHWAGIRGNWRIFAELVAAGAPVNATGSDGGTPLHWACHHDRVEMIALLLDAGADIGASNKWGRTPLHVAARRGNLEVAELLIDRGADPDAGTREGWTPLHVAAQSGHPEMMELLVSGGSDPDLADDDGRTASEMWRPRPVEIEIEPGSEEEYVGLYDLGGGFTVKVWREPDGLRIREFAPDGLYPIADDTFFCRAEPWRVRFSRNESGSVESVSIDFLRRTVEGTRTLSPEYIGSKACMECHIQPDLGNQYVNWVRSRHAHAYWRLASDWALFLGRLRPHYADLESPIDDRRCRLCHVTGELDDNALFAESFRVEEGIGCESCHGPGSGYTDPEVMGDRQAFLENGGRIPNQQTCRGCHRNSDAFDWSEKWPRISHTRPPAPNGPESSH